MFFTSKDPGVPISCACLLKPTISVFLLVSPAGALSNWTHSLGTRKQTNYHFLLLCFYIPSLLPFFSNFGLHPSTLFLFLSSHMRLCATWDSLTPPCYQPSLSLLPFPLPVGLVATHKHNVYLSWCTVHSYWCTNKNNNYTEKCNCDSAIDWFKVPPIMRLILKLY